MPIVDLQGTSSPLFQLGVGGAGLRSQSGTTVEARNAANSAYAPFRCDSIVLQSPLEPTYGGFPTGGLIPYAGSSAPAGFLLCDGSAISRSTYAGLFAAIGTTYGAGDGTTTFNLPNLLGRVPIGAGVSAASGTNRSLGATGGEDSHTLTTAELPSHAHTIANRGRTATVTGNSTGAEIGDPTAGVGGGFSSTSVGSGTAHNVLQPYIALRFIIKF